jgi:DNA-binding NtrC family response regulator
MERKLLIVDDEKEIVTLIEKFFKAKSYEVNFAFTGLAAIEKLASAHYDVVITDLKLPGMHSGMDILQEVRRRSPETVVIVITGYGTVKNAVEAMQLGAYDYVTKPFDYIELGRKIDRIFEWKDMLNVMEEQHEALVAAEDASYRNIGSLEWLLSDQAGKLRRIEECVLELLNETLETDRHYPIVKKLKEIVG